MHKTSLQKAQGREFSCGRINPLRWKILWFPAWKIFFSNHWLLRKSAFPSRMLSQPEWIQDEKERVFHLTSLQQQKKHDLKTKAVKYYSFRFPQYAIFWQQTEMFGTSDISITQYTHSTLVDTIYTDIIISLSQWPVADLSFFNYL